MPDIGQIIVDQIKKYASSDAQLGFYYENAFGYLYIHDTLSADISFTFYLLNECANDYLSLPDGNKSDYNHNTIKIPSFNDDNSYHPLPEGDLSYVYLH
jgi:hypothetical protein